MQRTHIRVTSIPPIIFPDIFERYGLNISVIKKPRTIPEINEHIPSLNDPLSNTEKHPEPSAVAKT